MGTCTRRNVRPGNTERIHVGEIFAHVFFDKFHWLDFVAPGAFQNLVLATIRIIRQVTDIRDVLHIAHAEAREPQPLDNHIKADIHFGVAQMCIVIDGWSADIQVDAPVNDGFKGFFFT